MNSARVPHWLVPGCLVALAIASLAVGLAPQVAPSVQAAEPRAKASDSPALTSARERAALTHAIYATTLEMLHRHYFRRGQAVLPARAMEDVFADAAEQTKIEGSWIAVNTKAMSVHHEPKTDFEKQAATALAAGQDRFEAVDGESLRIARPIPLGEGCLGCHSGMFRSPPSSPRIAGLIITVPLK